MKCPKCGSNKTDFLYFVDLKKELYGAYRCLVCGELFFNLEAERWS